jgi:hypothetical protein
VNIGLNPVKLCSQRVNLLLQATAPAIQLISSAIGQAHLISAAIGQAYLISAAIGRAHLISAAIGQAMLKWTPSARNILI